MLISVHLPKTAGSSFKASLQECFNTNMLLDYSDLPINTPPSIRNRNVLESGLELAEKEFGNVQCIHGHFMPAKYLLLNTNKPLRFVTWMREPVERVISHYHFWYRRYWPEAPPLHKRIVEEQWSLEKFCLSEEMKNLYAQFLWGFPLYNFAFIGITEHYEDDFNYFSSQFLNCKTKVFKENTNPDHKKIKYDIPKGLRKKMEQWHELDCEIYNSAIKLRKSRNPRVIKLW